MNSDAALGELDAAPLEDAGGSPLDAELEQPEDCREAPCTGLHYCDLLSGACLPGCGQDNQCAEHEVCDRATHECVCAEGWHRCGAVCVSDQSVDTCGTRCSPCETDADHSAICERSQCIQTAIYQSVSAGNWHACALKPSGGIDCYGQGNRGQLDVPEGRFTQVSASMDHACALRENGQVVCWGTQLSSEERVFEGPFRAVFSAHNCNYALHKDSQMVTGWGRNDENCLEIPPGDYLEVRGGDRHACALTRGGEVLCWGSGHDQILNVPEGRYKKLAVGSDINCALTQAGEVRCWGSSFGSILTRIPEGQFKEISAGIGQVCAIDMEGQMKCWGSNAYHPSALDRSPSHSSISLSGYIMCVLAADQTPVCWGNVSWNSD